MQLTRTNLTTRVGMLPTCLLCNYTGTEDGSAYMLSYGTTAGGTAHMHARMSDAVMPRSDPGIKARVLTYLPTSVYLIENWIHGYLDVRDACVVRACISYVIDANHKLSRRAERGMNSRLRLLGLLGCLPGQPDKPWMLDMRSIHFNSLFCQCACYTTTPQ